MSKTKTYLHMCIYVQSKGSFAYYHISTVQRFHSSTFPEYHVKIRTSELTDISHISTFQGYSKVINVMCNTFYCDDVFCALLPREKGMRHVKKRFFPKASGLLLIGWHVTGWPNSPTDLVRNQD